MSNEKEILKGFKKWADDALNFNKLVGGVGGAALEAVDGLAFGYAIDKGYEVVPDDYKDEVLSIMEAIQTGNVDTIADEAIDGLVDNITTPLGDWKERLVLTHLWAIIKGLAYGEPKLETQSGEPGQVPNEPRG